MIHWFKRATTHAFLAFATTGTAVATVAKEANEREVAPWQVILILGGFLVMFAGALSLAFVRWLNKAGRNLPRDPVRTEAQLASMRQSYTQDFEALRIETIETRRLMNAEMTALRSELVQVRVDLARTQGQIIGRGSGGA